MPKLSSFMLKTIRKIVATGGKALPAQGGYWTGADGKVLEVEPEPDASSGIVSIRTINALEDRGMLIRANEKDIPWRDPRIVTESGRTAAFQLSAPGNQS